ncbi:MAG: nucleoid-associated protein [Lachnospiraceae bacterium]|nr:nucleoid-associated protein [Lachnospiraceae bacterium]
MEKNDIIIRNVIFHILDTTAEGPIKSDYVHELTSDITDMLRGQIYHLTCDDDVKDCVFDEENSEFFKALYGFGEGDLTAFSQAASEEMFKLMMANAAIPDGDLFFATCQIEGVIHLAIIKMGYKTAFVHSSVSDEGGVANTVKRQAGILPGGSSKPSEGALINLADYTIRLAEKKVDIDGKKDYYLSKMYFGCHGKVHEKAKMNIVTKAMEKVNEEFYPEDFKKDLEVKQVLKEELSDDGAIVIAELPEKIYPANPEARQRLTEEISKYHIENEEIRPKATTTVKKLEKQFLVTDSGIEINIPMEQYTQGEDVEFIENEDGTISVLIKHISRLTTK